MRDGQTIVVGERAGQIVPAETAVEEPDLGRMLGTYRTGLGIAVYQADFAVALAVVQLEISTRLVETRQRVLVVFLLVAAILCLRRAPSPSSCGLY